jgi:hypothetical protein
VVLAGFALYRRYHAGYLLTAVSGLHANMLIFMGLGPLSYTFYEEVAERIAYFDLIRALAKTYWFVLAGYGVAVLLDYLILRRLKRRQGRLGLFIATPAATMFFGALAIIGAVLSQFDFTLSSVGTIFPVFRTLLYPALLISFISYRRGLIWNCITGTLFAFTGLSAFLSPWRSALVMFTATISLVFLVGRRKRLWMIVPTIAAAVYVIMPFQIIKRENYDTFSTESMTGVVQAAYDLTWQERNEMVKEFIATRVNTARELAYVESAVDGGVISYRGGDTYIEALQQLIPRIFWAGKPSFSDTVGYLFPRVIGLLGWDDTITSWGVGLWAEFCWNFRFEYLALFIPLIFGAAGAIDFMIDQKLRQPVCAWMAHAGFFFMFLGVVSIASIMTYVLWLFLVLLTIDRLFDYLSRSSAITHTSVHEDIALRRG